MAVIIDLAAKISERSRRLDQVDQALAEFHRLLKQLGRETVAIASRKRKCGPQQLRLPFISTKQGKRKRRA
jgi:hypothetical protein